MLDIASHWKKKIELRARSDSITLGHTLLQTSLTNNKAENCNLMADSPLRSLRIQMYSQCGIN